MIYRNKKHLGPLYAAFVAMAFSAAIPAKAVVASPGIIEASQPDGSTVRIQMTGDAHNHLIYSEDGYLLTSNEEGFYVFADVDSQGRPFATSIKAVNVELRSQANQAAIASLDKQAICEAFEKGNPARRAYSPKRGPGLCQTAFPSKGSNKSVVVLVEFSDNSFTVENPKEYYQRFLNEEGFSDNGAFGSVGDWFKQNSSGGFAPDFDVYGPVKLPKTISYYGGNTPYETDANVYEMVIDACKLLDDEVDFSLYDANNDGLIDNVYVYYAGYGESDGGGPMTIWPHSWDLDYATNKKYYFDGVRLNHYACAMELRHSDSKPDGIGPFCHEFSHVMGLPDLYCTDGSQAFTPGNWSVIDSGSYNYKSTCPPFYSSFERYALEWIEPIPLTESGDYTLEPLSSSNKAYIVKTDNPNEYFLFENRQFEGFDKYIPGHGMLVWHIDFDQYSWDYNLVNNDPRHQRVDLIEADNTQTSSSRPGDSFPGRSNVTEFTPTTKPAFVNWAGKSMGISITDIREIEGVIYFHAEVEDHNSVGSLEADESFRIDADRVTAIGCDITVYTISGLKAADISAGSSLTLPAGFYILNSAGRSCKVIIR